MKMTYKSFYNFFQINIYSIITKDTWQLSLNDKHTSIEEPTMLVKKSIKKRLDSVSLCFILPFP